MAALLRSKALFSSNGKVVACQFYLNEDSLLHLNSLSLLVQVLPSSKAPRLTTSSHLNQLHRETSKQQQQQKTPSQVVAAEWGVPCGSETASVIRKRSSMGTEGADYFSL